MLDQQLLQQLLSPLTFFSSEVADPTPNDIDFHTFFIARETKFLASIFRGVFRSSMISVATSSEVSRDPGTLHYRIKACDHSPSSASLTYIAFLSWPHFRSRWRDGSSSIPSLVLLLIRQTASLFRDLYLI